MDLVKNNIGTIARGIFLSSFAAFVFTSIFTSAAVAGPMFDEYLSASVGNVKIARVMERIPRDECEVNPNAPGCRGDGGDPRDWELPVGATATLSATPATVDVGGFVTVSWSSDKVKSCILTKDGVSISTYTDNSGLRQGPINTETVYNLTCKGEVAGTQIEQTATVAVDTVTGSPTVTVTASPVKVDYNGEATISWTPEGATSCSIFQNNTEVSKTSPYLAKNLIKDTVFKVKCSNSKGSVADTVTVEVFPPKAPTIEFTLDPVSVPYNGDATLSWISSYATKCVVGGFYPTINGVGKGEKKFSGLKKSLEVTATCDGEGLTKTIEKFKISVEAATAPTATLTIDPASVAYKGDSKVSWTSVSADSCSLKQQDARAELARGSDTTKGELDLEAVQKSVSYVLKCKGPGGEVSKTANLTVAAAVKPTVKLEVDKTEIEKGGSVSVSWSATGANTCSVYKGSSMLSSRLLGTDVSVASINAATVIWAVCTGDGGSVTHAIPVQLK